MSAVRELSEGIRAGDRRALARGITLVESTRADHRDDAVSLVDELLPETGHAVRVGVSGAPGVGKSTFIEALGLHVISRQHKAAVLAVDPSSTRSGGSILGDKTRMTELARHPDAFIRPSPSGGTLGGVARRTREAMLLCEAFGFDVLIVETVGVGQSETAVNDMVDLFLLLVQPGGGDDLQGIKRGIIELADLVVVTKADGELAGPARKAAADYRHAVHLLRHKHTEWEPEVLLCSALRGTGVAEVWDAVRTHRDQLIQTGTLAKMRARQGTAWMWAEVEAQLVADFRASEAVQSQLATLETAVAAGKLSPSGAARQLLDAHQLLQTGADESDIAT